MAIPGFGFSISERLILTIIPILLLYVPVLDVLVILVQVNLPSTRTTWTHVIYDCTHFYILNVPILYVYA